MIANAITLAAALALQGQGRPPRTIRVPADYPRIQQAPTAPASTPLTT